MAISSLKNCKMKNFYIYIVTNETRTVLYTGITSNLVKRVFEHKNKSLGGFTAKYNVSRLVYYETAENAPAAIEREKQLKAGPRKRKLELINKFNPEWKDLYEEIIKP